MTLIAGPLCFLFGFAELELHAQRTLDDARATSNETRGRAHGGGHGAANCRSDFAKVRAALAARWIRKIGVVEQVEEVRTEPQPESFRAQRKDLGNRKVKVLQARAVVLVTSRGSHASRRR